MASENLRMLIERKDVNGTDLFIKNGGCVNGNYHDKTTPLFLAIVLSDCEDEDTSLEESRVSRADEIILRLIRAGANVNNRKNRKHFNQTILMKALSHKKSNEIIVELLKAGSDVNAKCMRGLSPIMYAISNNYDKELIRILIQSGADINHEDKNGYTPLYYALEHTNKYEIAEMIIDSGSNINVHSENCLDILQDKMDCGFSCEEGKCRNKELIDFLISKGLDLKLLDTDDNSSLIHWVECNYLIRLCIQCGLSVESKDENGNTPLLYVLKYSMCQYFDKMKSLLTLFHANPNCVDNEFKTPLHNAVEYSSGEMCEFLLYHESNLFSLDIYNKTPLDLLICDLNTFFEDKNLDSNKYGSSRSTALMTYYLMYVGENGLFDLMKRNDKMNVKLFESVLHDCKTELSKMKFLFIKDNLTFYQFCLLKRFYSSKPIDMSVDELNYNFDQIKEIFPIYHSFIIIRIKDNIIKSNRRRLVHNLYGIIIRPHPIGENDQYYDLNYDCKYLISHHLNHKQLVTLFQASTED